MNKILPILVFVLPTFLFSYEINFSKTFSKTVSPDLLTTYVNVSVTKQDEKKVNSKIEDFNKYIKNNNIVDVKDGKYTLSPRYKYVNKKQIFTGYLGSLRYKIESNNAKDLNSFIEKLINLKDKVDNNDVKLNVSNINWTISSTLYNNNLDTLRIDTIIWINEYAKNLSTKLSKKCEVKNINISSVSNRNIYYAREAMVSSAKVASDVTPASNDENITINPNFVLECK